MSVRNIFRKIFPKKSAVDFPKNYIPYRFVLDRINHGPVLIVGDAYGREYSAISNKIKETYLLDIVDNKIAPSDYFIKQTVEDPIPFPDGYFKAVIINEVLEFLWEDRRALLNARKVLSDDGVLLLGVPFLEDSEELHFNIYTPRALELLLKHSGFFITEKVYRGLIVAVPNYIVALASIIILPIFGSQSLTRVNSFMYGLHMKLGRYERINKLLHFGGGKHLYGINLVARKNKSVIDSVKEQERYYAK